MVSARSLVGSRESWMLDRAEYVEVAVKCRWGVLFPASITSSLLDWMSSLAGTVVLAGSSLVFSFS